MYPYRLSNHIKVVELDELYRCCVVLTSGGYPGSYEKGKEVKGLEKAELDTLVFHAGTRTEGTKLLTNGGRVLNVVGSGKTLQAAIDNAYEAIRKIDFDKAYYRGDIGAKGLKHLG